MKEKRSVLIRLMSVSRQSLFLIAISLWAFGAYKVLSIGFDTWGNVDSYYKYLWLFIALSFFMGFIFPKVVRSNSQFILSLKGDKFLWYKCQKPSSWIVMIVMITFGIVFRRLDLAPESFISGFYIGLGLSLLLVAVTYYGRELIKLQRIKNRK